MNVRLAMVVVVCLAALCSLAAFAQSSQPTEARSAALPRITFGFNFPGATPSFYVSSVDSLGRASYESRDASEEKPDSEPYTMKFTMSEPTRRRIFELAKQLNYFNGNFEYKRKVANTGAKTLTYEEGRRDSTLNAVAGKRFSTTYNYSENPALQELTSIFQKISTTLEYGSRLAYKYRFDKLGLDAELKNMEQAQASDQLLEVAAISNVLTRIAGDVSVMNMSRKRAEKIVNSANAAAVAVGSR